MSNVNMEGLPPEMQARIASIIEGAKQKVAEAPVPQQPARMALGCHYLRAQLRGARGRRARAQR